MTGIYQQLEIPNGDKATSITETGGEYIYNFLKDNNLKKTLEVGFAYGCSTAYIISATKSIHYVIDPSQGLYFNLGLENMEKLGLKSILILKMIFHTMFYRGY